MTFVLVHGPRGIDGGKLVGESEDGIVQYNSIQQGKRVTTGLPIVKFNERKVKWF